MNFLELAKLLLTLLPTIIKVVTAIEQAMPQGSNGAAKLAIVKNTLETAAEYSGQAISIVSEVWNPLEKIITSVVKIFNETGTFKKSVS